MGRKLIVEVVEARDLLPKDGTGTSSPYVVVDFDGQRRRTQTAPRALNPTWNEALEFNLSGPVDMVGEPLEVDVLHDRRVGQSRRSNFLGRVRLDSRQFVRKGEEALIHFPLEKKSLFNWVRGDIGLRIYYVDEVVPDPAPTPTDNTEKTNEPAAPSTENGAAPAPPTEATTDAGKAEDTAAPPVEAATDTAAPPAEAATDTAAPPAQADPIQPPEAEPAQPAEQTPDATKSESEIPPPPPPDGEFSYFFPEGVPNSEKPGESELPAPPENGIDTVEPPVEQLPEAQPPADPPLPPALEKEAAPKWVPDQTSKPVQPPPPDTFERSSYDLVDKMQYLFVRAVRARSLPGHATPHVRLAAYGRHTGTSTARRAGAFFEWDRTIAFFRDPVSGAGGSTLQVSVWNIPPDSDIVDARRKDYYGSVSFDPSDMPTRDPPDSPLATQWYRLEGGEVRGGELMLAVWVGTQADESFPDAWKADGPDSQATSRSKVYLSPKLWYLRATILEAEDTLTPSRDSVISVRAMVGSQMLKTRTAVSRNGAPSWNEDLVFVVAEPFGEEQGLILRLESRHGEETVVLGSAGIPLSSVERRVDDRKVASRWLDLRSGDEGKKKRRAAGQLPGGRLHVRVCLDGGYHVSDEPSHACSDYRPSARQLWRPPLGVVELGIIGCRNLLPLRTAYGNKNINAFAVAKYGPKWARTRTARSNPTWNEQYTWQVYDPCTVLTVAVFDESDGSKESTCRPMGKVRIRISTLETNRAYRGAYPLLLLLPSGAKTMGEIELAVRFARAGPLFDLLHVYGRPMLPSMHHLRPIGPAQREPLRLAAARLVAAHLSRSEPPLRREVVLWVLEAAEPRGFSMRRVRANWHRIAASLAWIAGVVRWVEDTRAWRNPTATMLAHGVVVLMVWHPELVAPTVALHLFAVGVWRYRRRPRGPAPHPCVRASMAAEGEELDEEFDPVPSARGPDVVRARYDRARAVGARVEAMLGDVAAQAERVAAVVTWRDPRATGMFIAGCLVVAVALYVVPTKMVAVASAFYFLRHPLFRDRMPPPALNFFRRLPSMSERIM